jgi:hypothetical protein
MAMFRLHINTFAGVTVFTGRYLLNVLVHYINIQLPYRILGELLFLIDVLLITATHFLKGAFGRSCTAAVRAALV